MRIIVVLGGIFSGIGKGIVAASIGRILKENGFSVTAIKIDPYINYDAGTMRPTEHGEVWVTDDGGEIDQDLGNYERFLGISLPKRNNITTGQVYWHVIKNERKGMYLGKTVQFIPHIPNEIKRRVKEAGAGHDFVIVEIGGIVGDWENLPFLFAMRSFEVELGKPNVAYVLVTYFPIPAHLGEMKTKPTQQSIKMLNEAGIFPDFVVARATMPIDDVRKHKIETYANIPSENIISSPDVSTVYDVPLVLETEKFGEKIMKRFGVVPLRKPDWVSWVNSVEKIKKPSNRVKIAMVGKYVKSGQFDLPDSYISINHALEHAGAFLDIGADITWIDSSKFEKIGTDIHKELSQFAGVIVPGGFGSSGVEGKISAIKFCRENDLPFLGLCLGMQLSVVEFARNIAGMQAHSTEIDNNTPNPVIDVLPAQISLLRKKKYGATMRLGSYAANLQKNSAVWKIYKETGRIEKDMLIIEKMKNDPQNAFRIGDVTGESILERHRHRLEVNHKYTDLLTKEGLTFSGWHASNGQRLMEFAEITKLRFFAGTQAHPEFKSSIMDPAPLFVGFLKACAE